MTERGRHVAVGLTAAAGAVGLVGMLMLFGYLPEFMQEGYRLTVRLDHAGGLGRGSQVRLSGIPVGRVTEVRLARAGRSAVEATARIREGVRIPQNAKARIEAPLIGGGPYVELTADAASEAPGARQYLPTDGSATLEGRVPSLAGRFSRELKKSLEKPMQRLDSVMDTFKSFEDSFSRLSEQWTSVGQNMRRMTAPQSPEAVDDQGEAPTLSTVVARTDQRLKELRGTLEGVDRWARDEELREKTRATVEETHNLVRDARGRLDELATRWVALADELGGAVGEMRKLLKGVRAGEGTAGRLVQDPALYQDLQDASHRLERALSEAQRLLEKWKAEGVPIQY
jgi:phospholipid/cholesterol/gamma-HCH transport system substrate-binding protein